MLWLQVNRGRVGRRRNPPLAVAAGVAAALACAGEAEPPPANAPACSPELPRWTLNPEPDVSIGVLEGESQYQLFRVTGAVRLRDGIIALANAGTQELRYFDSTGTFLRSAGGRGKGPGEFSALRQIYRRGDTVRAVEVDRFSDFDAAGRFLGSTNMRLDTLDRFALDVWLFRRNWVDGVFPGPARVAVAQALRHVPAPRGPPWYRYVRRDDAGYLWVSGDVSPDGGRREWAVYDSAGAPAACVTLPPRFSWLEVTDRYVLGRWLDAVDVEYVQLYGWAARELRPADPMAIEAAAADAAPTRSIDEIRRGAFSDLRHLVVSQEAYFADHVRYAGNRNDLRYTPAEGTALDILEAGPQGWIAVLIPLDAPVICGLGIGVGTPPGWLEGVPVCADTAVVGRSEE
jgi:hypothetical protein